MRIVYWGTYDLGKPRNRILLRGLRDNGHDVVECHARIWDKIEDKSGLSGIRTWIAIAVRYVLAYPVLIVRYLAMPAHDVVVVGYLGQLDVLILRPFARTRGVPIVWDAFLSLYDTVVEDRRMVSRRNPLAHALSILEKLACRAADKVVLDTQAHADYFADTFGVSRDKFTAVPVGAEPEKFPSRPLAAIGDRPKNAPIKVLFYGQFIPLHGIETIIEAARAARHEPIDWILIGRGQEEATIRANLAQDDIPHIEWVPWVAYPDLHLRIHEADICLGIFGTTAKAARVVPNKVYQVLATGTPLITRDSPAMREITDGDEPGLWLVPPGDPEALLAALREFAEMRDGLAEKRLYRALTADIAPQAVGRKFVADLTRGLGSRSAQLQERARLERSVNKG